MQVSLVVLLQVEDDSHFQHPNKKCQSSMRLRRSLFGHYLSFLCHLQLRRTSPTSLRVACHSTLVSLSWLSSMALLLVLFGVAIVLLVAIAFLRRPMRYVREVTHEHTVLARHTDHTVAAHRRPSH